MGFQLLEQGSVGQMFTGDVEVLQVSDDEDPTVAKVRITVDGDALTLTLSHANAALLVDAITDAIEPPPP
jgi:hypothetical protein